MNRYRGYWLGIVALAAVSAAGCGTWRWSGHHKNPEFEPKEARSGLSPDYEQERGALDVRQSTVASKAPQGLPAIPAPPPDNQVLFYSDLGPNEVDVKDYPLQQFSNYRLFKARCAQCHLAARSLNAPAASRLWWWFYIRGMRNRSHHGGVVEITKDEAKRIAEFLEYDGQRRKVENNEDFERLSGELQRRFDAVVERRMERLQKSPRKITAE